MRRTSFANWPCSVARTMDLLGDWWTPLVLREAFYGFRRFDEFQQELGIARNTLADRLRRLVDEGLLEKRAYQSEPVRYDYVLTEMGRDFYGVIAAMTRWGDRWLADEAGPGVTEVELVRTFRDAVTPGSTGPRQPAGTFTFYTWTAP
ncbi:MAG: hypothetical protein QOI68_581 [Pseudonocardiales bacterium]|nr:hypothetical protein [Pseudonocardiales bacterium]